VSVHWTGNLAIEWGDASMGTEKIWDCGDKGAERKAELTASLPRDTREARDRFLERMTT
jgi:hypothetical protein